MLAKTGYALQGFPLIRSAFEVSELMDYLERNRHEMSNYLAAQGRFKRNLDWIRAELPFTEHRRKLFDTLNWLTHPNFVALSIYSYRDVPEPNRTMLVGPFVSRRPEMAPLHGGHLRLLPHQSSVQM